MRDYAVKDFSHIESIQRDFIDRADLSKETKIYAKLIKKYNKTLLKQKAANDAVQTAHLKVLNQAAILKKM